MSVQFEQCDDLHEKVFKSSYNSYKLKEKHDGKHCLW